MTFQSTSPFIGICKAKSTAGPRKHSCYFAASECPDNCAPSRPAAVRPQVAAQPRGPRPHAKRIGNSAPRSGRFFRCAFLDAGRSRPGTSGSRGPNRAHGDASLAGRDRQLPLPTYVPITSPVFERRGPWRVPRPGARPTGWAVTSRSTVRSCFCSCNFLSVTSMFGILFGSSRPLLLVVWAFWYSWRHFRTQDGRLPESSGD